MSLAIGVDVGGTKIAAGVVDEHGHILSRTRRSTPSRDLDAVLAMIIEIVEELAALHPVESVGIGTAGFVDSGRSKVLLAPNLGWVNAPLRLTVERATDLPVVVENDANSAAWGERRFGAGREALDLIAITVGTGIGGGLIFNGQLYRGQHGLAAEVGHMLVEPDGRLCGCGQRGCWEQYGSGNALVREARALAGEQRESATQLFELGDGTPEGVQGAHVTTAARGGDPVSLQAFATVGKWLGVGLANLTALLDPEGFVLGGGVSEAGDLLLGPTRESFLAHLSGRDIRPVVPDVRLAELGNDAGIVGAADLSRV